MRSISAFRVAATDPAVASARRIVRVIRRAGSGGAERGSMSVEMVVLAPVLLMVVLIAVAGGRYVSAEGMTQAAARDAARAASMERSAATARAAADDALDAAQTASGDCSATTSTASFGRGGSVDVEVRCRVGLSDLGLVFLPGATTISARATAPVDTLRGTS